MGQRCGHSVAGSARGKIQVKVKRGCSHIQRRFRWMQAIMNGRMYRVRGGWRKGRLEGLHVLACASG